jgi:hypothetical protein
MCNCIEFESEEFCSKVYDDSVYGNSVTEELLTRIGSLS